MMSLMTFCSTVSSLFLMLSLSTVFAEASMVGVGKADITPPITEIGFMGYGAADQTGRGLHMRLYARAYYWTEGFVFVNVDAAMIFHEAKAAVLARICRDAAPCAFSFDNVMISSTHTHSGPGGATYFPLYDITTLGFQKQTFSAIVDGIATAILLAQRHVSDVSMFVASGVLADANANRSPQAYLANPIQERKRYKHDVDKETLLLQFQQDDGTVLGLIHWFAVHGTSLNKTNRLVSPDNKGLAAYLCEKELSGVVCSFAQANEGDVSPNTRGAHCPNGDPCSDQSTCGGRSEECIASGPGFDMFDSMRIIGEMQFRSAKALRADAKRRIVGPVRVVHTFVDMSSVVVHPAFTGGQQERTCPGALGDSFAAGTTDGPGEFDFKQGTNGTGNVYWNWIASSALKRPSKEQVKCQYPKPILLDTGEFTFPSPWTTNIVPIQLAVIGRDLVLVAVPGEFTTMSGRRLRDAVRAQLDADGAIASDAIVQIVGLANSYTHYIATPEEYDVQRYEGASTLYGRWTLPAYIQEFTRLAHALATNATVSPGPKPPIYAANNWTFEPPVVVDLGDFGRCTGQPRPSYSFDANLEWPEEGTSAHERSVVDTIFVGADPRGRPISNYVAVEQLINGTWSQRLTDTDWSTRFHWARVGLAGSSFRVSVHLCSRFFDLSTGRAQVRIRVFGTRRSISGTFHDFSGTSNTFQVKV